MKAVSYRVANHFWFPCITLVGWANCVLKVWWVGDGGRTGGLLLCVRPFVRSLVFDLLVCCLLVCVCLFLCMFMCWCVCVCVCVFACLLV